MNRPSHPYFLYPLVKELKDCNDPERIRAIRERIAVNVGDPDVLMAIVGGPDLRDFYPSAKKKTPSTVDTIDAFIAKFNTGSMSETLTDVLEPKAQRKKKASPKAEVSPEVPVADTDLKAETAGAVIDEVKILVKKREYERALEIMTLFYLNNPKKSVYFADQIRYVRKMMLNERKKTTE